MPCQVWPLTVPGAIQRILGANDHSDDARGLTCYTGQLSRKVFKGGTVSEREEEEKSICLLLASLGMQRLIQGLESWQQNPVSYRALRSLSMIPPLTDWETEAQSREWLVPGQGSVWNLVPNASSELSQPEQHPQPIPTQFCLLQTRQARLSHLDSEAHLRQLAPLAPTQAHLPAHRQHVVELFERRLPAVPELKTEHDNTVAGLQLGRPKHHSSLDAWGGRVSHLAQEGQRWRGVGSQEGIGRICPCPGGSPI